MEAGDADALCGACRGRQARDFDIKPAARGERQFVLRDLIALGQVRVEIVFAGEARTLVNGTVERESRAHGYLDGALVENRKRAGKTKAHGANVGVWRIAETRGAAAKDFRFGKELDVDFEAYDRLVFRQDFRRERGGLWSRFRHKETRIIASAGGALRRCSG